MYIPKRKIQRVFDRVVRPAIAKQYSHHLESNEVRNIAGFTVGLRQLNVQLDLKLDNYSLNFVKSEVGSGKLIFLLENQEVKGQVTLHIDRDIEMIVKLGTLINKDYVIDFSFLIHRLVAIVTFKVNKDGLPDVDLQISLEDFELVNDLKYEIENSDLITDILSYLNDLWMPQVQSLLLNDLFPKLSKQITSLINDKIRESLKKQLQFDDVLKLQIDITCHDLAVIDDYVVATIDGHFNNYENPRNMDEVAYPTYDMPVLDTACLNQYEIGLQMSYDNIYTLIYAVLQNRIDFEVEVDKALCKSITIYREPNYSAIVSLLHETHDCQGTDIGLHVAAELFLKLKINLDALPNFDVKVKIKADVIDVKMLGDKGTDDASYICITAANAEVLTLYDDAMNSIVELHHNGKIYNRVRDYMASHKIRKEIALNKIVLGDHGHLVVKRILPFEHFAVVTADIQP